MARGAIKAQPRRRRRRLLSACNGSPSKWFCTGESGLFRSRLRYSARSPIDHEPRVAIVGGPQRLASALVLIIKALLLVAAVLSGAPVAPATAPLPPTL